MTKQSSSTLAGAFGHSQSPPIASSYPCSNGAMLKRGTAKIKTDHQFDVVRKFGALSIYLQHQEQQLPRSSSPQGHSEDCRGSEVGSGRNENSDTGISGNCSSTATPFQQAQQQQFSPQHQQQVQQQRQQQEQLPCLSSPKHIGEESKRERWRGDRVGEGGRENRRARSFNTDTGLSFYSNRQQQHQPSSTAPRLSKVNVEVTQGATMGTLKPVPREGGLSLHLQSQQQLLQPKGAGTIYGDPFPYRNDIPLTNHGQSQGNGFAGIDSCPPCTDAAESFEQRQGERQRLGVSRGVAPSNSVLQSDNGSSFREGNEAEGATSQTVGSWIRRTREGGSEALVERKSQEEGRIGSGTNQVLDVERPQLRVSCLPVSSAGSPPTSPYLPFPFSPNPAVGESSQSASRDNSDQGNPHLFCRTDSPRRDDSPIGVASPPSPRSPSSPLSPVRGPAYGGGAGPGRRERRRILPERSGGKSDCQLGAATEEEAPPSALPWERQQGAVALASAERGCANGFPVVALRPPNEACRDECSSSLSMSGSLSREDSSGASGAPSGEMEAESICRSPACGSLRRSSSSFSSKRSISSHFTGKSRSFTCLSDAISLSSIQDLAKPENRYSLRRRRAGLHHNSTRLDRQKTSPLRLVEGGTISKKMTPRIAQGQLAMAVAMVTAEGSAPLMETLVEDVSEGRKSPASCSINLQADGQSSPARSPVSFPGPRPSANVTNQRLGFEEPLKERGGVGDTVMDDMGDGRGPAVAMLLDPALSSSPPCFRAQSSLLPITENGVLSLVEGTPEGDRQIGFVGGTTEAHQMSVADRSIAGSHSLCLTMRVGEDERSSSLPDSTMATAPPSPPPTPVFSLPGSVFNTTSFLDMGTAACTRVYAAEGLGLAAHGQGQGRGFFFGRTTPPPLSSGERVAMECPGRLSDDVVKQHCHVEEWGRRSQLGLYRVSLCSGNL
eukprot:TRINITY_DN29470_c0_g1_i1.p1 TRINITY_DN29470_c0_g1~~TRINITY_DN29470_c0_g1_i1.p1  ORF type:complete len:952 (-),score=147.74 TRINITY_DN29470_c0_g1_i1:64-2919(-)